MIFPSCRRVFISPFTRTTYKQAEATGSADKPLTLALAKVGLNVV